MTDQIVPDVVSTIWWVGVVVTLVVWVPVAIYSLHRTWRAAQSIRKYAAETLVAAARIVDHTRPVVALEETNAVAGEMVGHATAIAAKLGTVADVLAARAERG